MTNLTPRSALILEYIRTNPNASAGTIARDLSTRKHRFHTNVINNYLNELMNHGYITKSREGASTTYEVSDKVYLVSGIEQNIGVVKTEPFVDEDPIEEDASAPSTPARAARKSKARKR